ncbi:MAG: hypothetical protein IJB65_07860 [Clostridia bacterium]|nr:hypothetical protein [Clostridia bacterium]
MSLRAYRRLLSQTRQINKTLCGAIYLTVQNAAIRPQNGAACRVATRRREINPRPTVVRTVTHHHGHGVTYMRRVADYERTAAHYRKRGK